ncbi:MAG: hypothetical protein LH702_15600, partial [Phormidesmis sp. CAN_BIN44]|nr:hypothetical protein [Phormidesmis sp. CAN_BIN44]
MLELVKRLLSPSQYISDGHCYLWQIPLMWLHLISDVLIATACFSISAMLIYCARKRRDLPFFKELKLFGAIIVLCGTGHLLDVWTWHPAYWVSGGERAITALASCYAALRLFEQLPQFLALQMPQHLEAINPEREKPETERQRIEEALRTIVTERKQVETDQLQQMKLAALRADIGTALTEGESLQDMLNRCAIALHKHLDAAFARIWTLNASEQMLILQASAGMYTHLNGDHSRIAV